MNRFFVLCYFVFLCLFSIFSYLFVDENFFPLHSIFSNFFQIHKNITTGVFVVFLIGFFFFYFYILQKIQAKLLKQKDLIKLIVISCIVLLFSYPAMLSFDIFNYIASAKVSFFYHENPYLVMPIEFTHDPLLLFTRAANKTALYGPVWILLTSIPYYMGLGNILLTVFTFKAFAQLWYVLTVFLLYKVTRSTLKTAFFALNPLVVIETLVSGHNDIVMMGLLLLAWYFFTQQKMIKGTCFFILSIGIKFATSILLPLFLVAHTQKIKNQKIIVWSVISMYAIFFLSSFREEIYAWYALWFLLPTSLIAGKNFLSIVGVSFSVGLLLRYIPYMLLDTYFSPTPQLKIIFTFLPVLLAGSIYFVKKRLW